VDAVCSLITAIAIDLVKPHSSQQEINGQEKKERKTMATAALSQVPNL